MSSKNSTIIIIPARMSASRLPGKPLLDIAGKPMIQHVWERAIAANVASVCVATDHQEIVDVIQAAGGEAVMTRDDHPSGSDRVFEALQIIDPCESFQTVLNLQGDLPEIDPSVLAGLAAVLMKSGADLATLVAPATAEEASRPQVVKAVIAWDTDIEQVTTTAGRFGRALYFSRAPIPAGAKEYSHHIGVYGWRRSALSKFVMLPPSPLEKIEKLEQLRAIEAGMTVAVTQIGFIPRGVDTEDDLEAARRRLGH